MQLLKEQVERLPDLLNSKRVADILGISESMLKQYRTQRPNTGQVPKSTKIKGRVMYEREELLNWLDLK